MSEQPIEFVIHEGEHALYFSTSLNFSNTLVSAMNSKHSENGFANTWHDWFIVPTSRPSINQPEVKEERLDLPGGNGDIDLTSVLTGYPVFKNRTGDLEFIAINTNENWALRYSKLASFLNGQKMYMILLDDPLWYYEGRFKVDNWTAGDSWSKVKVSYTLYPYKRSLTKVDEDYLWDTIDFENGIIYQNKFINYTFSPNAKIGATFPDVSGPNGVPDGVITNDDITFIQGFLSDPRYRQKNQQSWSEYCSVTDIDYSQFPIIENVDMNRDGELTEEDRLLLVEYLDYISLPLKEDVYTMMVEEPSDFHTNYSNYYVVDISSETGYSALSEETVFVAEAYYHRTPATPASTANGGRIVYIPLAEQPSGWNETYNRYYYNNGSEYVLIDTLPDEFVANTYFRKACIDWSDNGWFDYFIYKHLTGVADRPSHPVAKPVVDSTVGAQINAFYGWKQAHRTDERYADKTEKELWDIWAAGTAKVGCFPDANSNGEIDSSDTALIMKFYADVQGGNYFNTPRGWAAFWSEETGIKRPFPYVSGEADADSELSKENDIRIIQDFIDDNEHYLNHDKIDWANYGGREITVQFTDIYNNNFQKYLRYEPVPISLRFVNGDSPNTFTGAKVTFINTNDGTNETLSIPASERTHWLDFPDWVVFTTGQPNEEVKLIVTGQGKFDISFRLGVL